MAHQMGICNCGKKRHWPKNSTVGDTWKCYNCGEIWTLVENGGRPTRTVGSKKPTRQQQQKKQMQKKQNQKSRQKQQHNNSSTAACFPKGTQILTPDGTKDISELKAGDFVVSLNKNKKTCISKVLKVKNYSNKVLWSIKFNDKSLIETTSSHSFLVGNEWVKSCNIHSGDSLSYYNNGHIVNKIVTSSTEIPLSTHVYNIYVENNFNFIANGMITHSFSYFRLIRMALWSIYSTLTQNDFFRRKNLSPQIVLDN